MKIGIRLHDLAKDTPENAFKKAKETGFDYIQLVFKKSLKDENGNFLVFNEKNAKKVATFLNKYDLKVAMLGAYFNPVHSNKELVQKNKEYFIEHLKYASIVGANYVGTETGSYNDDKWTYNPKNQTEEGYQDTMSIFKELAIKAKEYKTTMLMEPAYGHVIFNVVTLKRAINELNNEFVKVTIDLYNLLYIGNYNNYKKIFINALSTFKDDIKIIHLKDFLVDGDKLVQTGLGKGILDYNFIIENIKKYAPNATLVFEGVVGDDIEPSLKLIKSLL